MASRGKGENCSVVSPDGQDGGHKGGAKTVLYPTNTLLSIIILAVAVERTVQ